MSSANLTKVFDDVVSRALSHVNKNKSQTEQWIRDERLFDPDKLEKMKEGVFNDMTTLYRHPIKIRIGDNGLNGVLKDGKYKTQFETGTSGGSVDPDVRMAVEHRNWNVPNDAKFDDHPIYGYSGSGTGTRQYGKNIITLDKDLKRRSTYTHGDSMDEGDWCGGTATPVVFGNRSFDIMGSPEALDKFIATNGREETASRINGVANNLRNMNGINNTYWESQIHGGVTPKDFASITLYKPGKNLKMNKEFADKYGYELKMVDPKNGKTTCFYNCKEPTARGEQLLGMVEKGKL